MGFAGSGTNLYAYAGNDPVNFGDPTGLYLGDNGEFTYGGGGGSPADFSCGGYVYPPSPPQPGQGWGGQWPVQTFAGPPTSIAGTLMAAQSIRDGATPTRDFYTPAPPGSQSAIQNAPFSWQVSAIARLSVFSYGFGASLGNTVVGWDSGQGLYSSGLMGRSLGASFNVRITNPGAAAESRAFDFGLGSNSGITIQPGVNPAYGAFTIASVHTNLGPSIGLHIREEIPVP